MKYYSHDVDDKSKYCKGCGQYLMDIQEKTIWRGSKPMPECVESETIVAISHLVRN